jgi:hypothetical protein
MALVLAGRTVAQVNERLNGQIHPIRTHMVSNLSR